MFGIYCAYSFASLDKAVMFLYLSSVLQIVLRCVLHYHDTT